MDKNNVIFAAIVLTFLFWGCMDNGQASTTANSGAGCLETVYAETRGEWAVDGTAQRAINGLRAAWCATEGGQ